MPLELPVFGRGHSPDFAGGRCGAPDSHAGFEYYELRLWRRRPADAVRHDLILRRWGTGEASGCLVRGSDRGSRRGACEVSLVGIDGFLIGGNLVQSRLVAVA